MRKNIINKILFCDACSSEFELQKNNDKFLLKCKICQKKINNIRGVFIDNNLTEKENDDIYNLFWKEININKTSCKNYPEEENLLISYKKLIKGKIVLDAGVGDGRHLEIISRLKPKLIICVDYSDGIYLAKKRWEDLNLSIPIIFIKAKLENLKFKPKSIDFIWCSGVLTIAKNYKEIISNFIIFSKSIIVLGLLSENIWGKIYYKLNPLKGIFRKMKKKKLLFIFLIPVVMIIILRNLLSFMLKKSHKNISLILQNEFSFSKIFSLIQEPFISPTVNNIDNRKLEKSLLRRNFRLKEKTKGLLISYQVFERI